MIWGGRWERGFRIWNLCRPVADFFNVWQNQYSIVKQNKVKKKKREKKKTI